VYEHIGFLFYCIFVFNYQYYYDHFSFCIVQYFFSIVVCMSSFLLAHDYCIRTILSHRQRGSKSEIASSKSFPEISLSLRTKKLQTCIPIVKGVIILRNDTVTKNVVVRYSRGTLCRPMRLRLGSRPRCRRRPRRIRVYRFGRRCSWVTPALAVEDS